MITVRIAFEKRGESAYISLLDLQRVFHRLIKRSNLPVYYTQGYNPHIYLAFACPLPLGQESLCESCEVKTEDENADWTLWQAALQPFMPRGITITGIAPAVHKMGEVAYAAYRVTMPKTAAAALDAYNAQSSALVTKKTKRGLKELELKDYVPQVAYEVAGENTVFTLKMPCGQEGMPNLNPALLLNYLQQTHEIPAWQCQILRTEVLMADDAVFC